MAKSERDKLSNPSYRVIKHDAYSWELIELRKIGEISIKKDIPNIVLNTLSGIIKKQEVKK